MQLRSKFIFLFFISLFFSSCIKTKEKFLGFTKSETGLYYKLIAIGEGKYKPKKGEYLMLDLAFKTENDSLFLDTKNQNSYGNLFYEVKEPSFNASFEEGLMNMSEGDSMTFIVNSELLFTNYFNQPLPLFLNKDSHVKVDVKLNKILSKEDYFNEQKKHKEQEDIRDVEEFNQIQKYVVTNQFHSIIQESGLFYITLKEGYGVIPDSGSTVQIKMTGSFINGKIFDKTFETTPFEFTLGDEFQVVWGLQEGIKLMKEGEKAKLILPSHLAFGEKGSSTGIVPPYTTIIYDVELIKVK